MPSFRLRAAPPAALLLCAIAPCAALAAAADDEELGAVVVLGRLEETLPQELSRYGSRVENISAGQVQRGGYNDIAQTMQALVPGLYIAPLSGAFDYVELSLLGSRNSEVLWLVDGIRLNNRLYSTTTPLDTLPAHQVERIEVLEGGESLFYGTQSVAGTINIVTRQFANRPDGQIELGADTNEGRHANAYFRTAIGGHRFVLFGSKDKATGFQPFSDADFQPSGTDRKRSYDVGNYGVKYAYDFGDRVRTSFGYQHTDATLDFARPFSIARATNRRDEDLLTAKIDIRAGENLELFVKGYYHDWDTLYNETDNDGAGGLDVVSVNEFWGFKDYGANLLAKYSPGGPLDFLAGWDYQHYSGEDQVFLIAPNAETVHAPFAQVRTSDAWMPNLRLSLGARYNKPDNGDSSLVWSATGLWNATERMFLRTSFGTAFRLPDAYELFVIDPCCEQGNPNLKPERSKYLNLSLGGQEGEPGGFNWEIVVFLREVQDLIDIVSGPGGIDTLANTDGKTKVRGAEIILGGHLGRDLAARFSFTAIRSRTAGTDLQRQETPTSLAKLSVDYAAEDSPLYAGLTANHTGDLYRSVAGTRRNYGNYFVLDVNAGLRLGEKRNHRIGFRLENALDEKYASRIRSGTNDAGDTYAFSFLGTPRTLHATYAYQF